MLPASVVRLWAVTPFYTYQPPEVLRQPAPPLSRIYGQARVWSREAVMSRHTLADVPMASVCASASAPGICGKYWNRTSIARRVLLMFTLFCRSRSPTVRPTSHVGTIAVPAPVCLRTPETAMQPPVHAPVSCVWLFSLKSPFLFYVRVFPLVHLGCKHFQWTGIGFFFPV